MAIESREDFKQYCLRRLGSPVITINVSDEQVEDRIDDAIQFWLQYHYDASERLYLLHTVTQTDIDNKYITLDSSIIAIARVILASSGNMSGDQNIFGLEYQFKLNQLYNFNTTTFLGYDMVMMNLEMIDYILRSEPGAQFNRHQQRITIPGAEWATQFIADASKIIIECYKALDMDTFTDAWNDMFLKRYATALIQLQWGENISKFENVQLPGGITMNGQSIYDRAKEEIQKLEEEMSLKWEEPPFFLIG